MSKLKIDIPGWGNVDVENVVIDLDGTLATDGKIAPQVKEKIGALSNLAKIYILTANPQGPANEEISGMKAELIKVSNEDSKDRKLEFLKTLTLETTVAIGNGSNDQLILKEAALGIAVLGEEGLSVSAIKSADIVAKDVQNALDLLLKPRRLITLLGE